MAKYLLYSSAVTHDEQCGFQEWNAEHHIFGFCSNPAVGQKGLNKNGCPLCLEHWNYATALVSSTDIIREIKKKKRGET